MERRKLSGKKLLVLGSNAGAVDIVAYAKEHGARVSVADYLPSSQSPAKCVADEAFDVSTADVESLCEIVREKGIDGVLSGVSEFNILKAREVSERCGLRSYFDMKTWDLVETKDEFRKLCERFSVPCPQTYYAGGNLAGIPWGDAIYPAVVKPVDNGASQGVYVCASRGELEDKAPLSLSDSSSGNIIVEEFCQGKEFTAHYVILDGTAHLVCMDNRYPVAVHGGKVTTIPVARVYPSLFLDEYLRVVDPRLARLFSSLSLECAVAFVQGLYDEGTGRFSVFEAGLRSAAELPSRFLSRVTGNDYMRMLVDYTLTGETDYDGSRDDPALDGRCCGVVSFVARGARVGAIRGLEEAVANTPSVLQYESRYPVGSETPDGDTLRQLMIRFVLDCDSRESMAEDVSYLNGHVQVLDVEGRNMVLKFDPSRLWGTD